MIWLSGLGGIQPVGSQILSNVEIAGHSWNLWKGPNANWEVLSFVSATGNINDFNVDLNDFFRKSFVVAGVFFPLYFIGRYSEAALTFFRERLADILALPDLKIEYLTSEQGVASSQVSVSALPYYILLSEPFFILTQYLQAIQTGTEPFTGSADLFIANFSVSVVS